MTIEEFKKEQSILDKKIEKLKKEKENQRAEASRLRNYYKKELTRQSNHIKERKEQVTGMLRKIENFDVQNRALIEYAKVLKKKVLEAESQAK